MTVSPTPRYAAIYARVSTEDQARGFSLPTQLEACQKLAEHEEYTVPESYVLTDDLTGDQLDRPGLRRLRELVQTHTIAAAIVYDLDRLSRKMVHQLLFEEECDRAGIVLLVVTDPFEAGPEGALRRHIKGAFAEWEKAKILERTKRGMVGRAKAGHVHGGKVALGYRYVSEPHGGRWAIDDEEAAVVRRIFQLCLEGMPTRAIARLLTQERVLSKRDRHPTCGGRKTAGVGVWHAYTVHGMLTYEGYAGCIYYNKYRTASKTRRAHRPREEWVEVTVPAIITPEVFQAVQAQLTRNKALAQRNRKHEYLFIGGRLRCGRCGRGCTGSAPHKRRYRCVSQTMFADASMRCQGSLDANEAESRVWQAIEQVLQRPELIAAEVRTQEASANEHLAEI